MLLNRRQKTIVRVALSYALSNLDCLNQAFEIDETDEPQDKITVDGKQSPKFEENEVRELLNNHFPPV